MIKHPTTGDCWIVDKKVALAVLTFIILQFASVVWWAASTHANVQENTRRIAKLEQIVETIPVMGQDIKWLRKFLEMQDAK